MGVFGQKKYKKNTFKDHPFVVPNIPVNGIPTKSKGLDGWPDHQLERKIRYKVAMLGTALDLCGKGLCVGYFPKFLIKLYNTSLQSEFQLLELNQNIKYPKNSKQDIYLIKRKSDIESLEFKKMAKFLRKLNE